jgi:DNA topoisomerase-3
VDQSEKIKKFVPEPFWSIETVINEKGKAYQLKWDRGKLYDRTVVTILHSRIAM